MFQQKLRLAQSNLISSTLMLLFCCTTVPLVAQDNPQVKKKAVEESILLESGLLPDERIVVQSNHTETEEKILSNLKPLMQGKTTVIISHRVSSVRHCDNIIVLEDGAILEQGKHDELIAKRGVYFEINEQQQLETMQSPD